MEGLGLQFLDGLRDCTGTGTTVAGGVKDCPGTGTAVLEGLPDWGGNLKSLVETAIRNLGLCVTWSPAQSKFGLFRRAHPPQRKSFASAASARAREKMAFSMHVHAFF